eukprot:6050171-Alexandrium_andersonii.AAC.1
MTAAPPALQAAGGRRTPPAWWLPGSARAHFLSLPRRDRRRALASPAPDVDQVTALHLHAAPSVRPRHPLEPTLGAHLGEGCTRRLPPPPGSSELALAAGHLHRAAPMSPNASS